jgi:hypothetical protein
MKYTPCGCITQANLCGLSPHGELALQANVALTPYLKLGGCGNDLLICASFQQRAEPAAPQAKLGFML